MDFQYIVETFIQVGSGLKTTLNLFFITIITSIPLGFVVTLCLMSKNVILKNIAKFYVFILRSTPLILQLLFIYFGLPYLPYIGEYLILERYDATVIGFILNYAAYFAEIFRGGLLSIDRGQYDAAKVLGMSKLNTFIYVIVPQMFRVSMPSVSNETITLVKDTSLMFTLAIPEVLQFAKSAVSSTGKTFPFIAAGVIYLIMNGIISKILSIIEHKFEY